jgi:eukaryotic-like serine/threonine-protein kinase
MDTTLSRPPIGQLLDGRYRVASHLAHGGMATVYLGTDTRLDRTVALKIMHAELANDEDFVRRFVAEARSIARLSHPNVVTVFDQGADGRTLYLAMEYVPGRTLRDLLRERGRLGPREALDIMDGVLAGLAAAHAAGIAHRDVKPENVLLGNQQTVKVADFGLARMLSGVSHTKSGMIIGTAAYLAPEQVSGGRPDARTDVYAAGVMLFELLTGTQPHTGESPLSVAYKHVNEVVPPPSSVVPGLPPALDTLVALATSRDPDLRPADAGQFLHAITGVRNGLPVAPAAVPPQAEGGRPGSSDDTLPPRPAPGWLPVAPRDGQPGGWGGPEADPAGAPAAAAMWGGGPSPHAAWDDAPTGRDQDHPGTDRAGPDQPGREAAAWHGAAGPSASGPGTGAAGHDLIPGMAALPARQSYGAPRTGLANPIAVQHQPDPDPPGIHKTLIVSGGMDAPYPDLRFSGPAPREPRLQRLLYSRRLAYLALGLAVVVVLVLLGWWVMEGRYTSVPSVNGMTLAAARADLSNAGLKPKTGQPLIDNSVAKGHIIRTIPGAGARITRSGQVTLVVSAGPHMIQVPQVTGQALADAETNLKHAGLLVGTVNHTTSTTIPAGIVISTRPSAGASWPQTKPVGLLVSAGQPVPNFVGQPKETAEGWASANSVKLNEVTAHKSNQPAGIVIHQSVPAGQAFTPNQVITVVISPGPPAVAIPNVDGMNIDKAVKLLTRLGFHVQINGFGIFHNVLTYDPQGSAPKGTTITLTTGP